MAKKYLDDTVSHSKELEYEKVDHPNHYKSYDGTIEVQDVIEGFGLNWNLGNVCKYVLRSGRKPGVDSSEDLRKAAMYLGFELDRINNMVK